MLRVVKDAAKAEPRGAAKAGPDQDGPLVTRERLTQLLQILEPRGQSAAAAARLEDEAAACRSQLGAIADWLRAHARAGTAPGPDEVFDQYLNVAQTLHCPQREAQ
jgi:hypothetical protein